LVDRLSSRFSEYFFGDLRMAIRGQMKFSSKQALRLVQIALTKYCAEMKSDLVTVSLRRYRHCDAEEKLNKNVPVGYWDFDMEDEIGLGVKECLAQLKRMRFDIMGHTADTIGSLTALKERDARWERLAGKCEREIQGELGEKEEPIGMDDEDANEDGRPRGFVDVTGGRPVERNANAYDWTDGVDAGDKVRVEDEDGERKVLALDQLLANLPDTVLEGEHADKEFLQVIREKCRELNAHMTPQGLDRMSGRFHGQRVIGVTEARDEGIDWASDDEDAAFAVYDTKNEKYVHDYGIIECLRERKGKKIRKIDRVKISDSKAKDVEMLVRWYERPKKKVRRKRGDKRETWELPIRSSYTFKWLPFNHYLCRVDMNDDTGVKGHYSLGEHSRIQALEEVKQFEKEEKKKKKKELEQKRRKKQEKSKGGTQ